MTVAPAVGPAPAARSADAVTLARTRLATIVVVMTATTADAHLSVGVVALAAKATIGVTIVATTIDVTRVVEATRPSVVTNGAAKIDVVAPPQRTAVDAASQAVATALQRLAMLAVLAAQLQPVPTDVVQHHALIHIILAPAKNITSVQQLMRVPTIRQGAPQPIDNRTLNMAALTLTLSAVKEALPCLRLKKKSDQEVQTFMQAETSTATNARERDRRSLRTILLLSTEFDSHNILLCPSSSAPARQLATKLCFTSTCYHFSTIVFLPPLFCSSK